MDRNFSAFFVVLTKSHDVLTKHTTAYREQLVAANEASFVKHIKDVKRILSQQYVGQVTTKSGTLTELEVYTMPIRSFKKQFQDDEFIRLFDLRVKMQNKINHEFDYLRLVLFVSWLM